MKKMILIFIAMFILAIPCFAVNYVPKYNDAIKNYGIGLYFGDGAAVVYSEPNDKSEIIAKLTWDTEEVKINDKIVAPKNVFAVFLPDNAISAFIALDEQDNEYTKIVYDNVNGLSGWIKNAPETKVFYWRQLFYSYGKTKGLYIFANIIKDQRILRLAPDIESEVSYMFIYPKHIRLQLIKGNWALLKIVDYDNEQKVGWFQWRNSDGTLNMFPLFNGQ